MAVSESDTRAKLIGINILDYKTGSRPRRVAKTHEGNHKTCWLFALICPEAPPPCLFYVNNSKECRTYGEPNHRLQKSDPDYRMAGHGFGEGETQEMPSNAGPGFGSRSGAGMGLRRRRVLYS